MTVVQNDGQTTVWKVGDMATKIMGLVVYNVAWVEAYLRTKWRLDSSSRLATTNMGRKLGSCALLGELDPNLTQCARAEAYLHAKRHLDPCSRLVIIDMGRKEGLFCPLFFGGGSWIPIYHNVAWADAYHRTN